MTKAFSAAPRDSASGLLGELQPCRQSGGTLTGRVRGWEWGWEWGVGVKHELYTLKAVCAMMYNTPFVYCSGHQRCKTCFLCTEITTGLCCQHKNKQKKKTAICHF